MPAESERPPVVGRPTLDVSVVMRLEPVSGPMARWQPLRWVLCDVLPGGEPRLQADAVTNAAPVSSGRQTPEEVEPVSPDSGEAAPGRYWLHRSLPVTLYRDDAEGYFLNLSSPSPCFWVLWRTDDTQTVDGEPLAVPVIATLSYHDAGRWLDAQERVDQVPAGPEVIEWLRSFVDTHYQAEPKRRKRPQSFRPLTDRFGQPVRISTDKPSSGPGAGLAGPSG
ncbi:MAG: DUF3305 domain-containing protein [Burkholderiaceae bacterium]